MLANGQVIFHISNLSACVQSGEMCLL